MNQIFHTIVSSLLAILLLCCWAATIGPEKRFIDLSLAEWILSVYLIGNAAYHTFKIYGHLG
jgi:hypothetical protein